MRSAVQKSFFIVVFFFFAFIAAAQAAPCTLDHATGTTIDAAPFLQNAYGTRWNAATNQLAFMAPDDNGYYHIGLINPDGSGRRPLLSPAPEGWSQKHQGSPYWHPSGKYLMFIAEKTAWKSRRIFGVPDYEALPGFGRHDDIWLADVKSGQLWQLTDDSNTKDEGALIPVFSPDGRHVAWSARQPGGTYALMIADFSDTPAPHLAHIRSYQPGGAAYYETGSFTADSRHLVYTSDQDTHSFWQSQIYLLDLQTGKAARLTQGKDYNEHPTIVHDAGGDWVVYMSTKGVNRFAFSLFLGTDWYAMRTDGSGAKRLTTMNLKAKDNPENTGKMQVGGTVAASPDGTFVLGDVQDSLTKQSGMTKVVRFTCP